MKQNLIIILNGGGWGDGDISKEVEAKSILKGIQETLHSFKLRYRVLAYQRIEPKLSKKIRALKSGYSYYRTEAQKLSEKIQEILKKAANTNVLILGYSAGGILTLETMRNFLSQPRVYAIHLGTPFFAKFFNHPRVLDLRRKYDLVARGHFFTFLIGVLFGFLIGSLRLITFRTFHPTKAFHVPGHYYTWRDKNIREPIEGFLKANFRARIAQYAKTL